MMSRTRTPAIIVLAILALAAALTTPTEAQIPKGKCYTGNWQIWIEDSTGTTIIGCPDYVKFGSTNLNSICFADKGPYSTVQVVDTVTEIAFSGLRTPDVFLASGGPFSGSAYIDRNGAGSSLAAVFHGRATFMGDDDGPGPSNGSFIGIQVSCSIPPSRPAQGTLGEWRQVLP